MCDFTRKLRAALNETGLQWEIRKGKKHNKLFLQGRLISVYSRTTADRHPRGLENILAHINRAARNGKKIDVRTS